MSPWIIEVVIVLFKEVMDFIPSFAKYVVIRRCKKLPCSFQHRERILEEVIADIEAEPSRIIKLKIAIGFLKLEWPDIPSVDSLNEEPRSLMNKSQEDE